MKPSSFVLLVVLAGSRPFPFIPVVFRLALKLLGFLHALSHILVVFAVISAIGGVLAISAPGTFLRAIWPQRETVGADLFVQGWGACLLALSALTWTNRNAQDTFVCKSIALALFVYFGVAAAVWFADARVIGWTLMSAVTFVGLSAFASAFGYLRFQKLAGVRR